MEIIILNEDNVNEYADFIPGDIAENIGREYYEGIVVRDEARPAAGMIWEVRDAHAKDSGACHIKWLRTDSDESRDCLFEKYAEFVKENDIKRSTFSLPAGNNKEQKQVLKQMGFSVKLMESDTIIAKLSEITDMDFLYKIPQNDDIKPLRAATQREFEIAIKKMIMAGHRGLCQDLEFLPRLYFENDISCYYEKDGLINGMLLFHKNSLEKLEVVLLAAVGRDYVKILPQMMRQSMFSASEIYDPETEFVIDRHDQASLMLSEKLFPRGFGIPVYIGERAES